MNNLVLKSTGESVYMIPRLITKTEEINMGLLIKQQPQRLRTEPVEKIVNSILDNLIETNSYIQIIERQGRPTRYLKHTVVESHPKGKRTRMLIPHPKTKKELLGQITQVRTNRIAVN